MLENFFLKTSELQVLKDSTTSFCMLQASVQTHFECVGRCACGPLCAVN